MKKLFLVIVPGCSLLAVALAVSALAAEKKSKPGAWRGQVVTEFDASENERFGWEIVNDGVMGGLSKGKVDFTDDGTMTFTGNLSLKNNGGFSTVRSKDVKLDLSGDLGLLLRVKGDGRTYQARLGTDARFRGMEISFMGEFKTTKDKWEEVKVPFASFEASFRGMSLEDEVLDPSKIQRIGILLGDKTEGPFEMEIDWIRTYGKGQGVQGLTATKKGAADLVETVLGDGRFKTLATALTEAELIGVLKGKDPLTVFAPTDEAFAKLPEKVLQDLLLPENREKLVSVLTYHVSPGASGLGDALKARDVPTVQGATIGVTFAKGAVRINEATLIDGDLKASNGIVHVIDAVLLPPEPQKPTRKTVLSVAAEAGSFSTLLAAIKAADLESVLEGEGPFTVFAPTEAAFAALPKGTVEKLLKKENREDLAAVLTYHVVPGRVTAGDALNAGNADSVQGAALKFAVRDGLLKVNDSTIRTVDLDGGNGVIHVIDSVLLPPANKNRATAPADSKREVASDAAEMILAAIEKGVPLYNKGDSKGCADVYRDCIAKLASNEEIDDHTRRMLAKVVDAGERHHSDDGRAWFYRRALDGMMAVVSRTLNQD